MIENQKEHIFIVTADAASIRHAQHSPIALAILQGALLVNGMKAEDRKRVDEKGLFYLRKVKI